MLAVLVIILGAIAIVIATIEWQIQREHNRKLKALYEKFARTIETSSEMRRLQNHPMVRQLKEKPKP